MGSDGNAYAWGYNYYGQLGDGTTTSRTTPVIVRQPDTKTYPDRPADFTYVQVSAGGNHSLALGSDGYVYAWGRNDYGQLGNGTKTDSHVPVRVRDPANPTDASKGLKAIQVSAGSSHSLALDAQGNIWTWGSNNWNVLGQNAVNSSSSFPVLICDPAQPNDKTKGLKATLVSTGYVNSSALDLNGNIWVWGANDFGQLGNGTRASGGSSTVPVRVRDPASPNDTSKGLQATQVSGGQYHSLAMGMDGNAYAWGYNNYGQLGDGTQNNKSAPVPVIFNLQLVITGVRFDRDTGTNLKRGVGGSVSVLTPAHQPGTVTVSVDYTLGGAPQTPDTSLRYTYLPAGVLPKAGGEGILLALATGMTGMGGVLASRRHRKETRQLLHASHE